MEGVLAKAERRTSELSALQAPLDTRPITKPAKSGPAAGKSPAVTESVASSATPSEAKPTSLQELLDYQRDFLERTILFWDTLRQRADNMLEHERAGMPPLLDFKYETLLDARRFEHPANYALLRITEVGEDCWDDCVDLEKPPVIIVDPRAGHGPGIGGFKRESEVGMAMREGHPVCFVIFFPEPSPGQTLADVLHALRRFVEEVAGYILENRPCSTETARPVGRSRYCQPIAKVLSDRPFLTARLCPIGPAIRAPTRCVSPGVFWAEPGLRI